jgi:lipopolysaccharide biosynthesis glycosyltransferase
MFRVFIGYDSIEPIAFHVLSHSILRRASVPVSITPLVQSSLLDNGFYTRARGPTESTEFSLTRFLVPYLSDYQDWSVFMDCDMLCVADLREMLWHRMPNSEKAVFVCQHDYVPKTNTKFLGQVQTTYPRKNWSSVMLFNNARCRALTPEYVNTASGLELHRFLWLKDEKIGTLPLEWNWLVGEYPKNEEAKILHYTLGGPWFEEYRACDHAEEWFAERDAMMRPMVAMTEADSCLA